MGVLNIYINDINLDNNFDADDPDTIILIRLLACILNLKNAKHLKQKISEELMPIAWNPKRWWNFCISEDEKKEIEPIFIEGSLNRTSVLYNMEVLKHFLYKFSCLIFLIKMFKSI